MVRDGFIPGLVEDGCTRRPPPCKAAIELGSRKDQERRWGKSRRGGFGRWRSWGDSPRTRRSREAEERLRLLREVGAVADAAEGRAGKGQRRHETNGERNARRKRSKGSWRGPLYTTDDFYWEVGAFDEDLVNRRRAAGLLGPEAGVGNDESWEWGGEFINSEAAEPECLCQILHPDVGVMTSGAPARQDQLGTAAPGVDSEAWPEVEAPSGWGKLPATPPTAPSPPACAYQYAAAASKRVRVENPTGWGPQNGVEAAERRLAAEAGVKEPGYGQSAAKPLGEVKPGKSTKRESASTDGSGSSGLPLLHIFTEGIGKRESAGSVLCACWKSRRGGVREEGLSKERGSLDEQPAKWLGSNGANSQGNTRDAGGVAYEAAEVDLRTALAQLQKRTVYGKGMRFFRRWEGQVAASRKPEGAFLKAKAGVVLEGCMSGDEQRRAGATSLSQNTGADTKEGAGVTGGVAGGVAEEDQTDEKAALKKVVGEGALAEKETRTQARRRRGKEARRRRRERRALRREERKRVLTRRVQKLEARGCIRKASLVKEYLQGLPTGIAVRQAAAERRARKALRKVGASGGDAAPPLSVPDCLAAVGEMSQTALEGCGSTGAGGAEGNGAMGNGALQAVLETTKPEEEPANSAAEGSQSRAGSTQYQLFGRVLSGPTVMVKVPSGATAREVMHAILAKNKAFPGNAP